jgi:hypothetical protein
MLERKQETKLVKNELSKYGINAKIEHGRGTGWGWLDINIGDCQQFGQEHIIDEQRTHRNCPKCKAAHIIRRFVIEKTLAITGRQGDYDGRISVTSQNHWSDKKGSIPIVHDLPMLLKAIPELKEISEAA